MLAPAPETGRRGEERKEEKEEEEEEAGRYAGASTSLTALTGPSKEEKIGSSGEKERNRGITI